ncbi:MAG: hypothetical protein LC737_10765, partial [Chloroflexi bacterium]|nr:hypothetical protein [Chloroflexota bacterium]
MAKKILPMLLRAPLPLVTKVEGVIHLTAYLMHPLIVLAFVLSIPMVLNHSPALGILPYLTIPTIGTLSLYATASW